jgi:hypothetical protein
MPRDFEVYLEDLRRPIGRMSRSPAIFRHSNQVFRVPTLVGLFHSRKSPTEVGTLNA